MVGDKGWCALNGALWLRPIGSRHKAVPAGEVEQETHQTHAARTDLDTEERHSQNAPLQACQARTALKTRGPMGAAIERGLPGLPRLPGGAGPLKRLGRLALRYSVSVQVERGLEQVGPLKPVPELMAVAMVAVWQSASRAPRSLSLHAIGL